MRIFMVLKREMKQEIKKPKIGFFFSFFLSSSPKAAAAAFTQQRPITSHHIPALHTLTGWQVFTYLIYPGVHRKYSTSHASLLSVLLRDMRTFLQWRNRRLHLISKLSQNSRARLTLLVKSWPSPVAPPALYTLPNGQLNFFFLFFFFFLPPRLYPISYACTPCSADCRNCGWFFLKQHSASPRAWIWMWNVLNLERTLLLFEI